MSKMSKIKEEFFKEQLIEFLEELKKDTTIIRELGLTR